MISELAAVGWGKGKGKGRLDLLSAYGSHSSPELSDDELMLVSVCSESISEFNSDSLDRLGRFRGTLGWYGRSLKLANPCLMNVPSSSFKT